VPGVAAPELMAGWASNGKEIFVMNPALPIRVFRLDVASGMRQPVVTIEVNDRASVDKQFNLVMTPDGRGYMYDFQRRLSDLYLVEGLR
jgi:hypothetical protein